MTEDGRIRDHVFVRGAWRDSITYSILEHEWAPLVGIATEGHPPPAASPDANREQDEVSR